MTPTPILWVSSLLTLCTLYYDRRKICAVPSASNAKAASRQAEHDRGSSARRPVRRQIEVSPGHLPAIQKIERLEPVILLRPQAERARRPKLRSSYSCPSFADVPSRLARTQRPVQGAPDWFPSNASPKLP